MADSRDVAADDNSPAMIPDELTADMTPADFVAVLRDIRFRGGLHSIRLDRDARQFLVDCRWIAANVAKLPQLLRRNVTHAAFGSKADIGRTLRNVRF
jgi:hypothetical protein